MELKESVARQKQALLKTLSEAIKIRSVQEEAKPGMPFGEGPAKCLPDRRQWPRGPIRFWVLF